VNLAMRAMAPVTTEILAVEDRAQKLMYAGAPRVVASLWQVSDVATAELMKKFYTGMLQRRQPAAAALRAAQLELARDPRWASPYFWAGFVLQGDWK
jgi:CHAT domain-containing protein